MDQQHPGMIGWIDLTVGEAGRIRDFYAEVAGWTPGEVDMGGYADWVMTDAAGQPAGGICHARGVNAALPPQWLIYIMVDDLPAARERAVSLGATIVDDRKDSGFCVFRDVAGAAFAVMQLQPDATSAQE